MRYTTRQPEEERLSGWLPFGGLTPGRTVAVETNKRDDNIPAAGASWNRQRKQYLRIYTVGVEVESVPIARVDGSTVSHWEVLMCKHIKHHIGGKRSELLKTE